jgi:hypothetical protein
VAEWHKGKSTIALGGDKDKWVIMTIFRNLLLELENLGKHGLGERDFLVQTLQQVYSEQNICPQDTELRKEVVSSYKEALSRGRNEFL